MSSDLVAQIDNLLADSIVYLTSATTTSILKSAEKSGLLANKDVAIKFVALCLLAACTNKQAVVRELESSKYASLRSFLASEFFLNNSINNNVLSQAGLCFLTSPGLQKSKFGQAWKTKYGKDHPWDSRAFASGVSEKQKEILNQKISRFTESEARGFVKEFLAKSNLAGSGSVKEA
jgi:hypothetical protein